jgi:hypothetical protein
MKKLLILSTIFFVFNACCKKAVTVQPYLKVGYNMNKKINSTYNSTTQVRTIDSVFTINYNIEIFKSPNDSVITYANDTFAQFNTNSYNLKNGNFPLISLVNDSIFISTKKGGVSIQSWEELIGKKIN